MPGEDEVGARFQEITERGDEGVQTHHETISTRVSPFLPRALPTAGALVRTAAGLHPLGGRGVNSRLHRRLGRPTLAQHLGGQGDS